MHVLTASASYMVPSRDVCATVSFGGKRDLHQQTKLIIQMQKILDLVSFLGLDFRYSKVFQGITVNRTLKPSKE